LFFEFPPLLVFKNLEWLVEASIMLDRKSSRFATLLVTNHAYGEFRLTGKLAKISVKFAFGIHPSVTSTFLYERALWTFGQSVASCCN